MIKINFKYTLIFLTVLINQQSFAAVTDDFVMQIKTDNPGTSANNEFTIQTTGTGYNYNVDCDVQNLGTNTVTGRTGNYTCSYAVSGIYNIAISDNVGDKTGFPRIFYNHTGDRKKLIKVSQWGTGIWTSMAGAFRGASNLLVSAGDVPDLSAVTDLSSMFRFATFANPDTSLWDVSQVTTMHSMFRSATNANPDTSNWDTANVTTMKDMFRNATSADPDVSGWIIKKVTDMSLMFENVPLPTASYDSILIAFASQSVKNNVMFNADNSQYCSYLGQQARVRLQSVYNWTIDDIGLCGPGDPINDFVFTITTQNSGNPADASTFTIPTTGTGYKYNVDCNDDGSFEASGLTGGYTCDYSALAGPGTYTIRIEDANGDGTGFPRIQFGNSNTGEFLEIIELNNWGTGIWDDMESAFESTYNMQILANDGPNLSNVSNASRMFRNAQLANPETALWDTSNIEDMSDMFANANQANPDTSLWNTQNVSDMSFMFYFDGFGANVAQPNTSGWDTSGVKFMQGMFHQANLADPNTSNWNTQNVSNMSLMFASAVAANPDTSGWFTGGVTDMNGMFVGATSANPDTSGWNTANVTDMGYMFAGATSANPTVSSWDVTNVGDMGNMFIGLTLSVFDYDAILDHFNSQAVQSGIFFTGGNSTYCAVASHDNLANATTGHGWIINDGGLDASCSNLADDFVIEVDTTITGSTSNTQFEINTSGAGYNYNVDCDDANTGTNIALAQTGNYTCNYLTSGVYRIRIQDNVGDKTGFPRIYSLFHDDRKKITQLKQWGTGLWTSMKSAFYGASNMVVNATDNPDLSNLTSLDSMFRGASLANPNTSSWSTTTVTNMSNMFNNASLANPDTSSWNTNNVTDMSYMFSGATSANPNVSTWNVASVEDMSDMFASATSANPVSGSWVTGSVTDMSFMFDGATSANPDVSNWNVSNVEDMESMFEGATSTNPNTSSWNTANVTSMYSMFFGATSANPDASSWDITNVTSMTNMFVDVALTANNYDAMLTNFASQNVTQGLNFHAGNSQYCAITAHASLENSFNWNITDDGIAAVCAYSSDDFIITVNTANTQAGSSSTIQFTIPISTNSSISGNYNYNVDCDLANIGTNIASGVSADYTCSYATPGIYTVAISDNTGLKTGFPAIQVSSNDDHLKIIELNQWGTGIWLSMVNAFEIAENMEVNATDVPDLSVVTNISGMFSHAYLANPDVSNWDTSNIQFMGSAFFNATSANPDVSNWNTSQATNMSLMFAGATVANPNVSGWITTNVVSMFRMFSNAISANPDVSNWVTSNVTTMSSMFDGAVLANPDVGNWVTSSVTNMERMFAGASVANPDVSGWNTSSVTNMASMFSGATLANPNVSNWITTSVTNMKGMFSSAANADPDVSSWDTANVIFMNAMFRFATSADPDLSSWDVENVSNMTVMFLGVTLSLQNYDAILVNFSSQNLHSGVTFHGGNSTYCNVAAHDILENTFSWSITDGGLDAGCPSDVIFSNGFEAVVIFKSAAKQFEYDFAKTASLDLDQQPLLIAQGINAIQLIVIEVYLRNDLGQLQIRKNYFDNLSKKWTIGDWQSIDNNKLTMISWLRKGL